MAATEHIVKDTGVFLTEPLPKYTLIETHPPGRCDCGHKLKLTRLQYLALHSLTSKKRDYYTRATEYYENKNIIFPIARGYLQECDDINEVDEHGRSALHYACGIMKFYFCSLNCQIDEEFVEFLLRAGADLNIRTKHDILCIEAIATFHTSSLLRSFLDRGVDPNLMSKNKPLIYYATCASGVPNTRMDIEADRRLENFILLLDSGANPNVKMSDDKNWVFGGEPLWVLLNFTELTVLVNRPDFDPTIPSKDSKLPIEKLASWPSYLRPRDIKIPKPKEECSICLERYCSDTRLFICEHCFCKSCGDMWTGDCPLCRSVRI